MRWVGRKALRTGVVGVLALAAACSSGDGAGDEADAEPDRTGLAFVEVLRQDEIREVPPSDIYLVELGEPLEDGLLVDEDSGLSLLELADIDQHPYEFGRTQSSATLPDGRLLVAVERPDSDEEYLSRLGAVVVDPESGEVHEVVRSGDGHRNSIVSRWDPERLMLRTGLEFDAIRCFAWDEETAGSGFTELECPPYDSPEDAGSRLAHWDFDCCDPFQLTDRETGEVVFEQEGLPHPPARVSGDIPRFFEQEGDTLVFTSPTAPEAEGPSPFDLLVLRTDGEIVAVEPRSFRGVLDRGIDQVRLVGDVVLYTDVLAGSQDRLARFDLESEEVDVLLDGDRIAWGVVPAEQPWLVASQQRGDPEGNLGEPEPLLSTLWVGDPETGALEQVAEWPDQEVELSSASFDRETGALYVSTAATGDGDGDGYRESITLWRVEPGAPPTEVASGPQLQLVDVAPDGESLLVMVGGLWQMRLIVDGASHDLGEVRTAQFIDDDTVVYWEDTSSGAPYTSRIVSRSLADPANVEVLYDDRTADGDPRAVRLGPVFGARPSTFETDLFCTDSCDLSLPQPSDLGACIEYPDHPGC